jgi:FADH2-dependent halogenase
MTHDVIIIGGGPAGTTTATFLAQAGRKVLLLEKETFPRFHIGESLLPYNQVLLKEMGVLPALEAAGFPRKVGAQFHLGNGSKHRRFLFSQGRFTRHTETFQVERAIFDHILLQHARASGAEVREGWTVRRFANGGDEVSVEAADARGSVSRFQAAFLVDASGRANLTGNQEGLRVVHPKLKKVAIFGHFTQVHLDPAEAGGDTIITRLDNKWFWIIPVSATKTSVGLVMDKEELAASGKSPEELFRYFVALAKPVKRRMAQAQPVGALQTAGDFSYHNRRLAGLRLLRTGDAAGFMDPIFSAGVFLAMRSGKLAARAIQQALSEGHDGQPLFAKYERTIQKGMTFYWRMVEGFYTTPFMEIFLHPRENFSLTSAVNAVLAGELEGGWRLRWRLEIFFLLVRLQRRWALTPRIAFTPGGGPDPFAFLAKGFPDSAHK